MISHSLGRRQVTAAKVGGSTEFVWHLNVFVALSNHSPTDLSEFLLFATIIQDIFMLCKCQPQFQFEQRPTIVSWWKPIGLINTLSNTANRSLFNLSYESHASTRRTSRLFELCRLQINEMIFCSTLIFTLIRIAL